MQYMDEATQDIFLLVKRILREKCKIEGQVGIDARLAEDLRLDSVGMLTLALEIENHYRMNLGDEPDSPPRTVQEIVNLIKARLSERKS